MKYKPKHMRESSQTPEPDNKQANLPDVQPDSSDSEIPRVHPLGIPYPDADGNGEYIPIPGDTREDIITPNGAVVRNPWSEQPEIKPDYAYTDEQEDKHLLIM